MIKKIWSIIWYKIQQWAINTVWPWFKANWFQVINLLVIWIAFVSTHKFLHIFIGAWFWIMIAYYLGWKLLGIEKLFKKKITTAPFIGI
jgi:hypothetical protein